MSQPMKIGESNVAHRYLLLTAIYDKGNRGITSKAVKYPEKYQLKAWRSQNVLQSLTRYGISIYRDTLKRDYVDEKTAAALNLQKPPPSAKKLFGSTDRLSTNYINQFLNWLKSGRDFNKLLTSTAKRRDSGNSRPQLAVDTSTNVLPNELCPITPVSPDSPVYPPCPTNTPIPAPESPVTGPSDTTITQISSPNTQNEHPVQCNDACKDVPIQASAQDILASPANTNFSSTASAESAITDLSAFNLAPPAYQFSNFDLSDFTNMPIVDILPQPVSVNANFNSPLHNTGALTDLTTRCEKFSFNVVNCDSDSGLVQLLALYCYNLGILQKDNSILLPGQYLAEIGPISSRDDFMNKYNALKEKYRPVCPQSSRAYKTLVTTLQPFELCSEQLFMSFWSKYVGFLCLFDCLEFKERVKILFDLFGFHLPDLVALQI